MKCDWGIGPLVVQHPVAATPEAEDDDEDIGNRRRKVISEFTPDNEHCVGHLWHRGNCAEHLIKMAARDVDLIDSDVMTAHRDPDFVQDLRTVLRPDE